MSVPNKQIGWSNESSLLQYITKQLERLTQVTAAFGGGGGGGITANTIITDHSNPLINATVQSTASLGDPVAGALATIIVDENGEQITTFGSPDVNIQKVNGTATASNTGNADAGTIRVVLATNQPTVAITEQAPLNSKYILNSILDGNNLIAATTNYFPSALGMSMDGYADMSITGYLQLASGTISMAVEASNDEDPANANWIQIWGFDTQNNTAVNSLSITNTSATFAWDFDNLNYYIYRIKIVSNSGTNTARIKMRRKAI